MSNLILLHNLNHMDARKIYEFRHQKSIRKFIPAALNFSLAHLLKLKYFGTFTHITQIDHSNAHLNALQGVFSDIPLITAKI